jgi:hypothetical protein
VRKWQMANDRADSASPCAGCLIKRDKALGNTYCFIVAGQRCSLRRVAMDQPVAKKPFAFQPFTPRGIAAFGETSWGRLFLVQAVVALFAATMVIWLVRLAWFPVLTQAAHRLPREGEIRGGKLRWNASQPQMLAENYFLAVSVDLDHAGGAISPAHVGLEMERRELRAYSILGYVRIPYPTGWRFAFNQPEVEPAWGAWRPAVLALVGALTVAALFVSWTALATVYFLPAWMAAYFANRRLTIGGSWRLAGASLMPGAMFFSVCLVVYGFGGLDLIRLAFAAGLHLLIGWIYLGVALARLPHESTATAKTNPFAAAKTERKIESESRLD